MATAVTSLARSVLDPVGVCRTLSASITGTHHLMVHSVNNTIRKTKEAANRTRDVALGTVRLATRPFVWPINLSLDLSRRLTIQVLITMREILVTLNDLVTNLEKQLEEQEQRKMKGNLLPLEAASHRTVHDQEEQQPTEAGVCPEGGWTDCGDMAKDTRTGDQEGARVHRDAAHRDTWRRHLDTSRKLKEENNTLKRRVRVTENKYELMNSQITALKELYRDKMSDMEYDLNDLKQQRNHVMSLIQSAQTLANDCHGDVQTLMEELHDLTSAHAEDLSTADSLSLDLGLEGLTLTSQQRLWRHGTDSDTGYVEDSESDKSLTLRRVFHRTRHHNPLSATSSVTSLDDVSSPGTAPSLGEQPL